MANIFDLTVATPQEIVITNTVKTEEVYDAGALQRSNLYKVMVPNEETGEYEEKVVTRAEIADEDMVTAKKVAYKNAARKVQMYKTNTYVTLEQGDSVKITAEFSEEVAYFMSLASEDLQVVVSSTSEATVTPEDTTGDTTTEDGTDPPAGE